MTRWTRRALSFIAGVSLACSVWPDTPSKPAITVFAASSLTNVLQELGGAYTKATGVQVKLQFAASSVLARQIESGAPADVFLSADQDWMNELETRGLIVARSRRDVAANRLVLVTGADSDIQLKVERNFRLLEALAGGRLAIGDPRSVPAGKYAREALTNLGVWSTVESRTVLADNVRAALAFVARGEVPLGIVYDTDALINKSVRVVDFFPEDSYAPIRYPMALTKAARAEVEDFARFVSGPDGQAAFGKFGFRSAK